MVFWSPKIKKDYFIFPCSDFACVQPLFAPYFRISSLLTRNTGKILSGILCVSITVPVSAHPVKSLFQQLQYNKNSPSKEIDLFQKMFIKTEKLCGRASKFLDLYIPEFGNPLWSVAKLKIH